MAVMINAVEEFKRDWDWYTMDHDGYLGHFTSAGMRALPRSVKNDLDAAELIVRYFFEQAPARGGWSLRAEAEEDCEGLGKAGV